MAISERTRSVPGLIADLFSEGSSLLRTEMLLARTELSEKVTQGVAGIGFLIGGAVFLIGAINVLLAAAVTGLVEAGIEAPWASIIVAAAAGVIGFIVVRIGLNRLKVSNLVPQRTTSQLKRDAELVKERAR